eukprot:gene741-1044_t
MRVTIIWLLLATAAVSHAAFTDYLNPLRWDSATQHKALQLLEANGLLPAGIVSSAAAVDNPQWQFSGRYLVTFSVGGGCPAAVVAFGTLSKPIGLKADAFACRFTSGDVVAISPGQQTLIDFEQADPQLFKLANPTKIPSRQILCGYTLYTPNMTDSFTKLFENGTFIERSDVRVGGISVVATPPTKAFVSKKALNVECNVNFRLVQNENLLKQSLIIATTFDNCFPGRAAVQTPAGPKSIAELKVGDRVLAVDPATGATTYDEVFLTPHRDSSSFATYLNLHIVAQDKQVA